MISLNLGKRSNGVVCAFMSVPMWQRARHRDREISGKCLTAVLLLHRCEHFNLLLFLVPPLQKRKGPTHGSVGAVVNLLIVASHIWHHDRKAAQRAELILLQVFRQNVSFMPWRIKNVNVLLHWCPACCWCLYLDWHRNRGNIEFTQVVQDSFVVRSRTRLKYHNA